MNVAKRSTRSVRMWFRGGSVLPLLCGLLAVCGSGPSLEFTFEQPGRWRPRERIVWHDVNGDGRNDLIRQMNRHFEVYLMGDHHHVEKAPAWRLDIVPPWDLWDFIDVRSEHSGKELVALSPQGLGWLSFHEKAQSTADMKILIADELPIQSDPVRAYRGGIALPLRAGYPPDLLLPSRKGLKIYRRSKALGQWELAGELSAPLRPRPSFAVLPSKHYLAGFGNWPTVKGFRTLTPASTDHISRVTFQFESSWRAQVGQFFDWNGDGRLDWSAPTKGSAPGQAQIFLQDEQGRFDLDRPVVVLKPGAEETDESAEDSDSGDPPHREFSSFEEFHTDKLADVDGDGRLDFVRIDSVDNWANPKTRVAVYLQNGQGAFFGKPDALLRVRAIIPTENLPMVDLNSDGDLDLLLLELDLQVTSANSQMKAFFRKGLKAELGAYPWNKKSGYPGRPAWKKEILITHDMIEFTRQPEALMQFDQDLTGDGRPDLVLRTSAKSVGVFAMVDSDTGFSKSPTASLETPFKVEGITCRDFDGDGNVDVRVSGWDPEDPNREPWGIFFAAPQAGGKR